jgi:hypothetical protein
VLTSGNSLDLCGSRSAVQVFGLMDVEGSIERNGEGVKDGVADELLQCRIKHLGGQLQPVTVKARLHRAFRNCKDVVQHFGGCRSILIFFLKGASD